jgi:DNA polymerase-3 subunit alpha
MPAFRQAIRVPVTYVKGLTDTTKERLLAERRRGAFASLADFYRRVGPSPEEMELLIRVGALDGFGQSRPAQYWDFRFLLQAGREASASGQGWLLPPPDSHSALRTLHSAMLTEPSRRQRLEWEYELLGFPASGHPLELYDHIAWKTYCPVSRLGEFVGQEVVTCGLVIEDRVHHQVTGEPMKFLTLADWTGMIETELFAQTYKSYGLATVRYPVLEVSARVEPFENGRGFTLRVLRAGKPREAKG